MTHNKSKPTKTLCWVRRSHSPIPEDSTLPYHNWDKDCGDKTKCGSSMRFDLKYGDTLSGMPPPDQCCEQCLAGLGQ